MKTFNWEGNLVVFQKSKNDILNLRGEYFFKIIYLYCRI